MKNQQTIITIPGLLGKRQPQSPPPAVSASAGLGSSRNIKGEKGKSLTKQAQYESMINEKVIN